MVCVYSKKAIGIESPNRTPMAFVFMAAVAQLVERGFCKPLVESSIPSRRPNFSPVHSANCGQRLNLGLAPKAGLVPAVILTLLPEESNGQNDLPQLPDRVPEIREA